MVWKKQRVPPENEKKNTGTPRFDDSSCYTIPTSMFSLIVRGEHLYIITPFTTSFMFHSFFTYIYIYLYCYKKCYNIFPINIINPMLTKLCASTSPLFRGLTLQIVVQDRQPMDQHQTPTNAKCGKYMNIYKHHTVCHRRSTWHEQHQTDSKWLVSISHGHTTKLWMESSHSRHFSPSDIKLEFDQATYTSQLGGCIFDSTSWTNEEGKGWLLQSWLATAAQQPLPHY